MEIKQNDVLTDEMVLQFIDAIRTRHDNAFNNAVQPLLDLLGTTIPKTKENAHSNDFVEINGIKWLKENMTHEGRKYFQFDEAQEIAKSKGVRVPTDKEIKALKALGSTWDDVEKGRWFGYDHELKGESEKSIFLPAMGFEDFDYDEEKGTRTLNGKMCEVGTWGEYWSSDINPSSATYGFYLDFNSSRVAYPTSDYRGYGFPVRCVAE